MSKDNFQSLQVTERDQTLTPRQLRSAGFLPGTLYGGKPGADSLSIQVREREFGRAYKEGNRIFRFEGLEKQLVRVTQLQVDAVSQKILNVEFIETTQADAKASEAAREVAEREAEAAREVMAQKIAEGAPAEGEEKKSEEAAAAV